MTDHSNMPDPDGALGRSGLAQGTWVLVADGAKALFLENAGDRARPVLVLRRAALMDNPATREQGTDRPGRFFAPGAGRRGAAEATDWHGLAEDRFAVDLADILRGRVLAGEIGRLILVAPPRLLGALRRALHPEVRDRVTAELAQDLTGLPLEEIAEHVALAAGHPGTA
jgi:protein required for attachment to host cells